MYKMIQLMENILGTQQFYNVEILHNSASGIEQEIKV